MKHSYLFLADGFEEIEALATADILRRAGIKTILVSIKDTPEVTGANSIKVTADTVIADVELTPDTEWLIMPGGMPGATNLAACAKLTGMIKEQFSRGGRIASICASPGVVLGPLGVLDGRTATCYPGFESYAPTAHFTGNPVEVLDTLVTANGPGAAFKFGYAIVALTKGQEAAADLKAAMMYRS